MQTSSGKREDTVITANINVLNCSNLHVTVQIFGHGSSIGASLSKNQFVNRIFGDELFQPKSFAFVYAHNATRSKDRYFKIGRRQPGDDRLLNTQKITVEKGFNSYPQHEIEYVDSWYITQIDFKFDVSSMWSCVFFSHLVRLSS